MAAFTREEIKDILNGKVLCEGARSRFRDISIDSRTVKKGDVFIAIVGVAHDGHDFITKAVARGAAAVVISKNMRPNIKDVFTIRVKDTTKALGSLARAHRERFSIPVIAVTGSAGKTTTKEVIAGALKTRYHVLKNKASFNNQWGVPLTLLKLSHRYDAAIIEIGTNHAGEISYLSSIVQPTIAVLTNIGASHLEGLKTIQNVFHEKRSIIQHLRPNGAVVFNRDDVFLKSLKRSKHKTFSYGIKSAADLTADHIRIDKQARIHFRMNKRYEVCLKTPVMENVSNALAAAACARLMKIPVRDICLGLNRVRFCRNRQQIERVNGIIIINDSYNSNPISFESACRTLVNFPARGKRILVCGDMLELGAQSRRLHGESGKMSASLNIDCVFAFGPMMKYFTDQAQQQKPDSQVCLYSSLKRLNQAVLKCVQRGDVVLIKGSRGMHMERVVEYLRGVKR